jgi:hypothetical protein
VARAPPPANDEHSPKRQRTGGPLRVQELMDLKQLLDLSLLSLEEFANLKARLLADTPGASSCSASPHSAPARSERNIQQRTEMCKGPRLAVVQAGQGGGGGVRG